jgi:hypothetical protein
MPVDKSIFGLRFGSNAELQPTRDELRTFLDGPKKAGELEPRGRDLATYRQMLDRIQAFEENRRQGGEARNFRDLMFYRVLGLSSFFHPSLLLAIEQYEYHCHTLLSLDFKKPAAFIRSAEEEMSRLNPKKKNEADRLARLQDMVEERKKTLKALEKRWNDLTAELANIVLYIRDSLVRIGELCEGSIVILVDVQVKQQEEKRLIEDIKTHFKEHLRDSLHSGPVTKEHVETVKKDVAALTEEMSALVREDVYSLTRLFEAVHDHARKVADGIDALMAKIANAREQASSFEAGAALYNEAGRLLVSLVRDYRFEMKTEPLRTETSHQDILREKRKETLDLLFDLLQKERRARGERRTGEDRRKFSDPDFIGPEQRSGKDRRSGRKRR